MDLVKARERARQKAREEAEQKAAEEREQSAGRDGSAPPAPPQGPAARAKRKKAAATAGSRKKKKGAGKKPGKIKKPQARPPALVSEEEVFTDNAFGEDLPVRGPDEVACDEVVLAGEGGKAAVGPEARKKEKAGGDAGSGDEDLSWEVKLEEIRSGAAEAEPAKKPRKSGRGPGPAEGKPGRPEPQAIEKPTVPDQDDRGRERPRAGGPKPGNGADWRVEETAAPAQKTPAQKTPAQKTPARTVELEWEDSEDAGPKPWSLDDLAGGDDFFALVTEDLYAREFGRPEDEDSGATLELLSFKLASEIYGVRLTSIRQIIKMMPITTVPRAPEYVLGIISLRGSIIPIFDLRRRLNLESAQTTRKTRIIVVAAGIYTVGLIVDEVEQVVRIPETSLEPPPSMLAGIEAGYIKGIGRFAKKMVLVLALDKILVPVASAK